MLSGLKDEIVSPSHMKQLNDVAQRAFGAADCSGDKSSSDRPQLRFKTYPNGMHNDTFMRGGEQYWDDIRSFLEDVCDPPTVRKGSDSGSDSDGSEGGVNSAPHGENESNAVDGFTWIDENEAEDVTSTYTSGSIPAEGRSDHSDVDSKPLGVDGLVKRNSVHSVAAE